MKWTSKVSPLLKEYELRKSPVIIRVNKFDEELFQLLLTHMAVRFIVL
jgi:hypothetical protein